jgi:putative flippase GtrA
MIARVRSFLSDPKSGQILRFVLGGAANTLFSYCVYWVLLAWMAYPLAYSLSFAVAILSGYAINTGFVFRASWSWRKLIAYPAVYLVNYLAGLGVMWVSIQLIGIDQRFAPLVATVVTLPLIFLLTRAVVRDR